MTAYSGTAVCIRAPKKCHNIAGKSGKLVAQHGFSMTFRFPSDETHDDYIQTTPVIFCATLGTKIAAITKSGSLYLFRTTENGNEGVETS